MRNLIIVNLMNLNIGWSGNGNFKYFCELRKIFDLIITSYAEMTEGNAIPEIDTT